MPNRSTRQFTFDAFISYSRENLTAAKSVQAYLEAKGLRVFLDETRLTGGERVVTVLDAAAKESKSFVFLVSNASVHSKWVQEEYAFAVWWSNLKGHAVTLIPVLLEKLSPEDLPAFLGSRMNLTLTRPDNERQLDAIFNAVYAGPPAVSSAYPSQKLPDELLFLSAFPEGLLRPIFEPLSDHFHATRTLQKIASDKGLIRQIQRNNVELIAPNPFIVSKSKPLTNGRSSEIATIVLRILEQERVLGSSPTKVGIGLALLIRDLLGLAASFGDLDGADDPKKRVLALATQILPSLIDEGEVLIAFEIGTLLREFPHAIREDLMYANLLLHLGQSQRALELFELYRGEAFFDDPVLDPAERLAALQNWAKAAKEAGKGRALRRELDLAYDEMMGLLDKLDIPIADRKEARAEILNNRGTQLATFGDASDWTKAQADLDEAEQLYRHLRLPEKQVEIIANRVALTLDKLNQQDVPPAQLRSDWERAKVIAERFHASDVQFFFYYQGGRLYRRVGDFDSSIKHFGAAKRVAETHGLEHRAALAAIAIAKLKRSENSLSIPAFLDDLKKHCRILERYPEDPWSANAYFDALLDAQFEAQVALGNMAEAWQVLENAFQFALNQAGGDPNRFSRSKFDRMRRKARLANPDEAERSSFLGKYRNVLAVLLSRPDFEIDFDDFTR